MENQAHHSQHLGTLHTTTHPYCKELDVVVIEGRDKGSVGGVITTTGELCLSFLIVPVKSGKCVRRDTLRSRGRSGDYDVDDRVRGGLGNGAMEVNGRR